MSDTDRCDETSCKHFRWQHPRYGGGCNGTGLNGKCVCTHFHEK